MLSPSDLSFLAAAHLADYRAIMARVNATRRLSDLLDSAYDYATAQANAIGWASR